MYNIETKKKLVVKAIPKNQGLLLRKHMHQSLNMIMSWAMLVIAAAY
jgi:hypothetical protein